MRIAQVVQRLFLALTIGAALCARAAEIVYENSDDFSGVNYETTAEYGDEVILAGTARAITEIQIEYYADFVPQGDEVGRVRFYSNTGPIWEGNPDYKMPASPPLFETTFPLGQEYQTAVIPVPNIVVSNSFTWTVQFLGISQTLTPVIDRAGALFYGTPRIGASYDDFWELTPDGWGPVARDDVPKNNFGAQIWAVAGPARMALTITRVGNNILLTWPSGDPSFRLESKTDLNSPTWTQVSPAPTLNGSRYEVIVPINSAGGRFFRLRSP